MRARSLLRRAVALSLLTSTFAPGVIAAQPAPDASPRDVRSSSVAEARRRYAQGVVFFRGGHYDEAIAEFADAFAIWPNPTVLYSLAQSHERLLHVARAIEYYERYLALAPPDAPLRAEVTNTIRGLRSLLSEVEIESNTPARIFIDDREVGAAPGYVELEVGRHEVELRADGYAPQRQSIAVVSRTRREMHFRLTPLPTSTGLRPVWFWGALGVTAAGAITTAALGTVTVLAASRYQADPNRTVAMRDEGTRLAIATDASLAISAALAVGPLIVGLRTGWRPVATGAASIALDPAGRVVVGGRF